MASKILRILGKIVFTLSALFSGAAIVHGMVLLHIINPDAQSTIIQPSIQGSREIAAVQIDPTPVAQPNLPIRDYSSIATAPVPAPAPVVAPTPLPPQPTLPPVAVIRPKTPAPAAQIVRTSQSKAKSASTGYSKPVSVDLEKLSMAVAMTETHNCKDDQGSALVNNCFGIKKNGAFMSFSTPAQSHAYFKKLWVNGYGGTFPTYSMAQKYSGNDRPTSWLSNVTYYYNKL